MYRAWGSPANLTWTSNNPCDGSWTGIYCANNLVTFIGLDQQSLNGPIDRTVGRLLGLTALILSHNQLTGPLPGTMSKLTNLQTLALFDNQLSGSLPPNLSLLSAMVELNLAFNVFDGAIPPTLSVLQSLNGLHLQSNALSGSIPVELSTLNNLRYLGLRNNRLSGTLSPNLGRVIYSVLGGSGSEFLIGNAGLCGLEFSNHEFSTSGTNLGQECPEPPGRQGLRNWLLIATNLEELDNEICKFQA